MRKNLLPILLSLALGIALIFIKIQYDHKKQMLSCFQTLEFNLAQSNENVERFSQSRFYFLSEQCKNRPDEVRPYYDRAYKVKYISEKFLTYVENLKRVLIGKVPIEGWGSFRKTEFLTEDDFKIKPAYLDKKTLTTVMNKADSLHKELMNLLKDGGDIKFDPNDRDNLASKPYFKNCCNILEWNNNPSMQEAIIKLTKLQNDAINLEAEIIYTLSRYADFQGFTFDIIKAKVIPNALMIKVGSEYRAEVLLVSSNSRADNPVIVNGKALPIVDGKGIYTIKPIVPGIYYWEGVIQVNSPRGTKEYPFKEKYEAF